MGSEYGLMGTGMSPYSRNNLGHAWGVNSIHLWIARDVTSKFKISAYLNVWQYMSVIKH